MLAWLQPVLIVVGLLGVDGAPTDEAAQRRYAEELVAQLAKATSHGPYWVADAQADENDPQSTRGIMKRLAALGKPALPALIAALGAKDPALQNRAALILSEIGPDAADAIPRIVPLLVQENPYYTGRYASRALIRFGSRATPELLQAIRNPDPTLRWHATEVLGSIRPVAKETPAALIGLLLDESDSVKVAATRSLVAIGEPAVEPLVAAMEKDTENKLFGPCWILKHIGPPAKKAIPILREKLKAPYPVVEHATFALLAIEVERAAAETRSDDGEKRGWAASILSEGYWRNDCTPREGEAAVAALVALLQDPSADLRERGAEGLAHTAAWAKTTLSALAARAADPKENGRVRREAIVSLGTLRAAGREALPVLQEIVRAGEGPLHGVALRAIERIEKPEANLGCDE